MDDLSDIWLAHLRAIVDRIAPGPSSVRGQKRPGYRAVADAIHTDTEVVYQLYTKRRRVTQDVAGALDRAYSDGRGLGWINIPLDSASLHALPVVQSPENVYPAPADEPIGWGDKRAMEQRTGVFAVLAPDDSMHDRIRKGRRVEFERGLKPSAGDGVLVEDRLGDWYIRVYRPLPGGRFEAFPLNPAYPTLEHERDGLTVLAVLRSSGRWGG